MSIKICVVTTEKFTDFISSYRPRSFVWGVNLRLDQIEELKSRSIDHFDNQVILSEEELKQYVANIRFKAINRLLITAFPHDIIIGGSIHKELDGDIIMSNGFYDTMYIKNNPRTIDFFEKMELLIVKKYGLLNDNQKTLDNISDIVEELKTLKTYYKDITTEFNQVIIR